MSKTILKIIDKMLDIMDEDYQAPDDIAENINELSATYLGFTDYYINIQIKRKK